MRTSQDWLEEYGMTPRTSGRSGNPHPEGHILKAKHKRIRGQTDHGTHLLPGPDRFMPKRSMDKPRPSPPRIVTGEAFTAMLASGRRFRRLRGNERADFMVMVSKREARGVKEITNDVEFRNK